MNRRQALCTALAAVTGLAVNLSGGASRAEATEIQKVCDRTETQVRLAAGAAETYRLVGWLCSTAEQRDAQGQIVGTPEVDVLVPGATYDHNYWDWPNFGGQYSYVDAALISGFVTFSYDRLGTGESEYPPGGAVVLESEAYILEQLVSGLSSGQGFAVDAGRVVVIGHSLGAGIAVKHAATYNDVDAVVVTGMLHEVNPAQSQYIQTNFYPADQDAKFAQAGLPVGDYLTTQPNARGQAFYNLGTADSLVVQQDEQLKSTIPVSMLPALSAMRDPALSQAIQVPTLVVTGEQDSLWCSDTLTCDPQSVLNRELSAFDPGICLNFMVVSGAGHDINLHYNASTFFWNTFTWLHSIAGGQCPTPSAWLI